MLIRAAKDGNLAKFKDAFKNIENSKHQQKCKITVYPTNHLIF